MKKDLLIISIFLIINNVLNAQTNKQTSNFQIIKIDEKSSFGRSNQFIFKKNIISGNYEGAQYIIIRTINLTEKGIVSDPVRRLQFWNSELKKCIIGIIDDENANSGFLKALSSNKLTYDVKNDRYYLVSATDMYDTLDVEIICIDPSNYSLNIKYYSPI